MFMSKFAQKGWHYIPEIITPTEALDIKYKNLCGAVRELGSLKGHHDPERGSRQSQGITFADHRRNREDRQGEFHGRLPSDP